LRATPQIRSIEWLVQRPIAHRGLHDVGSGVLENTATAFANAIEGNYAIECDVQLTADGEAIVFHDETLDRVTMATGAVLDHTVQQLKDVRYTHGTDVMQTLPELLQQVDGRVPLVIEIKSHWDANPALALRVIECVQSYQGPFALMSFDPDVLRVLAAQAPEITRGIVADRVQDSYYDPLSLPRRNELRSFSHLGDTRPHFVSFDHLGLPFAPVQQIRAQGFPVITWTIKSEAEASRARRYSDQITFENFRPA
jgi:glycerophosphoryl diester phosphodiesterase